MKSENVKERPLTKLDEYAILISKHWKSSKTGADDYDPTSILVNFKKDIKEVIKNELISEGWTKIAWHKVSRGDLPKNKQEIRFIDKTGKHYNGTFYANIKTLSGNVQRFYIGLGHYFRVEQVIAWTELPVYKE